MEKRLSARNPRHSTTRRSVVVGLCAVLSVPLSVACADAPSTSEPEVAQTTQAIALGQDSQESQDYGVALQANGETFCTGVLVHPRIVITAHHCLSGTSQDDGPGGCRLGGDLPSVENLRVQIGRDKHKPIKRVNVTRLIYDPTQSNCAKDVAAMILAEDAPLKAYPPIRLDTPVAVGEKVTLLGWGSLHWPRDVKPPNTPGPNPTIRQQQTGTVLVGEGGGIVPSTGETVEKDAYIVSSIKSCNGDSGGPLLDQSGALVGVHSSGSAATLQDGCASDGAIAYAAAVRMNSSIIEKAFQAVGRMPTHAGQPAPAELGGKCTADSTCQSNMCITVGKDRVCSKFCTLGGKECGDPNGPLKCAPVSATSNVCINKVAAPEQPSCSVSTATGAPAETSKSQTLRWGLLPLLGMAALFARRGRRVVRARAEARTESK